MNDSHNKWKQQNMPSMIKMQMKYIYIYIYKKNKKYTINIYYNSNLNKLEKMAKITVSA